MTQDQSTVLYHQYLHDRSFVKEGMTYKMGINHNSAVKALIPSNKKMIGPICELPSELTLTNADLDNEYHEGFTIGMGKVLYWMLVWHKSGNCTVYSKEKASPRHIHGSTIITVHFK